MVELVREFGLSNGVLLGVIMLMSAGYGVLFRTIYVLFKKIEDCNSRTEKLLNRIEVLHGVQTRIVAVAGQRLEGEEFRRAIADALRGEI
tara:strand:- start:2022 stop:2291 length:270 start_codon:yes stop_codon:yes gene_type:complete